MHLEDLPLIYCLICTFVEVEDITFTKSVIDAEEKGTGLTETTDISTVSSAFFFFFNLFLVWLFVADVVRFNMNACLQNISKHSNSLEYKDALTKEQLELTSKYKMELSW